MSTGDTAQDCPAGWASFDASCLVSVDLCCLCLPAPQETDLITCIKENEGRASPTAFFARIF